MASYVVLARKWRPAQFVDIVGQGHVVRTLMNTIRAERLHHAYLFTGSRGIGKTSIARIFAKAIRCEHRFEKSEWLYSCDNCTSCKEIAASSSVDVIEIDGASNNGVEAIRELRENAKYVPASGGRKIYIIDEVHMLTTAAFNALLKTLEEPPSHVLFVFATTEPHKIPPTILSRCQRFDYRRVTLAQIQERLAHILQAENVPAEQGALTLIAQAAEGSMRDALSLLDQAIAFSGSNLTVQSVRESIGLIESESLLSILENVFARKPMAALKLVEQAFQQGHDLRVLTRGLIEFLHAAILTSAINKTAQHDPAANASLLPVSLALAEAEWQKLRSISELRPLEEMELIFQVLHNGLEWIARSPQPRIVLDVLLIKCATSAALVCVESAPGSQAGSDNRPITVTKPNATSSSNTTNSPNAPSSPSSAPLTTGALAKNTQVPPPSEGRGLPVLDESPPSDETKSWEGLITFVKKSRPLLGSLLEHGLGKLKNQELVVLYSTKDAYFKEQLQSRGYNEYLLQLCREYFGTNIKLQITLKEGLDDSVALRKERENQLRIQTAKSAIMNHPVIVEAKALFNCELGPIELTAQEGA